MAVRVGKSKLWKAIRENCVECVGTVYAVKDCQGYNCKLYPYRFGKAGLQTDLASEPTDEQPETQERVSESSRRTRVYPPKKGKIQEE
jgi:hypothetical protein